MEVDPGGRDSLVDWVTGWRGWGGVRIPRPQRNGRWQRQTAEWWQAVRARPRGQQLYFTAEGVSAEKAGEQRSVGGKVGGGGLVGTTGPVPEPAMPTSTSAVLGLQRCFLGSGLFSPAPFLLC